MKFQKLLLCICMGIFFPISCEEIQSFKPIPMKWKDISEKFPNLPIGISVFSGQNKQLPLNAWYVEVDHHNPNLKVDIVVSKDHDLRETLAEFYDRLGASVLINGGYFLMHKNPAQHVGLLIDDGNVISKTLSSMLKRNKRYLLNRSAIGFNELNEMDIAWIGSKNDTILEWDYPADNQPDKPAVNINFNDAKVWNVYDALQAGPVIVSKGRKFIADNEEVFFWSKIPDIHPRSAVGFTDDGKYIFMVIDGRQAESRGVDLKELSVLMYDLGCYEAINLDGGGSSALVVNGRLLNKPAGLTAQREVMSAIAVFNQK